MRARTSQGTVESGLGKHGAAARVIAFFGYDSTEPTVTKRVKAFQANNSRVVGFMFRRIRNVRTSPPAWENIELGVTTDRNYGRRIPKLLAAVVKVLRHKRMLQGCQIIYARNIDMLLIAVLAKRLAGARGVLVYEVLDVQRIFIGERLVNKVARWAERVLMRSCQMLVVSSPDFVDRYFAPLQRLSIPWTLLENKVSADQLPAGGEHLLRHPLPGHPPWVIGWFGTLRCVRSLDILCRLADAFGDRIQIYLRGRTSEEDLPMAMIEAATARHRNVTFDGPYANPDDLAAIYGRVHFSWAVDYLDAGTNSDWLLPNRVYEGGLFGSLALARSGTAAGRLVERDRLGWAFHEPLESAVHTFLETLDAGTYERARELVNGLTRSKFVDEADTGDLLARLDRLSAGVDGAASSATD
jgi:hypothetical protein